MTEQQDYSKIYFETKGSLHQGRLRIADTTFAFKDAETHKVDQFDIDEDVEKSSWSRVSKGYELRLYTTDNTIKSYSGFSKSDLENLSKFFPGIEKKRHGASGWNFGDLEVDKYELRMHDVENKENCIFDLPLKNVQNSKAQKQEIALELHTDDKAGLSLLEVRLHVPSEEIAENLNSVILDQADVLEARSSAIATFDNLNCLIPRGRYEMKLYEKFMHIRGKSNDYKIAYTTILRMFCVAQQDMQNFFFAISLDPPLRQGQTMYPFLIMQFHKEDEIDLELEVDDDEEFEKRYQGKLSKELAGPTFQVFSACLKNIAGRKVHSSGDTFKGKTACVSCSYKANQGYLYPLERAFLYLVKPPLYIRFDDIDSVNFAKGSTSRKSFELEFLVKGDGGNKTTFTFQNIGRDEYQPMFDFCQAKNIRIKNVKEGKQYMETGDFENSDDDHDAYRERMIQEGADSDSESDDEDFDFDKEQKKVKKADEEYASGSGSDISEVGDDSAGDESSGAGSDIIDMGDDSHFEQKKKKKDKEKKINKNKEKEVSSKKKKEKADPNKPKKPLSAYFLFTADKREEMKAKYPDLKVHELAKKMGELWKETTEKSIYEKKAEEAKERYKEAMKNYQGPTGSSQSPKASKRPAKDPNAPKKPQSSYFIWMNENRQKIKDDNPGISVTEIGKKAGELWKSLDSEEKAKYDAKAKKAKEEYAIKYAEYIKNKGKDVKKETPNKKVKKETPSVTGPKVKSAEFVDSSSDSDSDTGKKETIKEENTSSSSDTDSD